MLFLVVVAVSKMSSARSMTGSSSKTAASSRHVTSRASKESRSQDGTGHRLEASPSSETRVTPVSFASCSLSLHEDGDLVAVEALLGLGLHDDDVIVGEQAQVEGSLGGVQLASASPVVPEVTVEADLVGDFPVRVRVGFEPDLLLQVLHELLRAQLTHEPDVEVLAENPLLPRDIRPDFPPRYFRPIEGG